MKRKIDKEKQKKKEQKKALKLKKKVQTTLDWSEVEQIKDNKIILRKGKKNYFIRGIKIVPRNLFIETEAMQRRIITQLRTVFNQATYKIYWAFPHNPVDLDSHLADLTNSLRDEEDPVIQQMIQNDFEKAAWFQQSHVEIEFFLMIVDGDEEQCRKKYNHLVGLFLNTDFQFKELNDTDFENYIAYLYESPMINNYYFSKGVFACLGDESYVVSEGQTYNMKEEEDDLDELE